MAVFEQRPSNDNNEEDDVIAMDKAEPCTGGEIWHWLSTVFNSVDNI
jgi:hypothetical protein